jgi:hypothetical protein
VPCKEGMRKFTLFSLVENICPEEKVYHINVLFAAYGHTVIQLSPYVCNFYPNELGWHQIQNYIISHITTADMSLTRLQELVKEGICQQSNLDSLTAQLIVQSLY